MSRKRKAKVPQMTRMGSSPWTNLAGIAAVLSLFPSVLGCEDDSLSLICTAAGCYSEIEVQLEEEPAGPYRVEADPGGGTARYVYACDPTAGCPPIVFSEFSPYWAIFDVIVGADTTRYEVFPTYTEIQPNGPRCEPTCYVAMVRLPSDAIWIGGP
jgi:hypothetical protein